MMSLWDALRMNMMISYQELVRTFLSVEAENGFYLVTILEYDESGGDVRSIWDKTSSSGGHVIIRGNYWPERQLTKDFDLVVKIFKEFFHTGNVSIDLLN
ncbi:DUF6911 family protein [Enterobacter roggenkampii]|uniref:DUF6911 family protein n=1 Tax=Enterobacter roggenkampii TaxID=1812935 RepID=UPI001D065261|nr:hypothetical protein [Enterobacter roggenkampii]MCB7505534.1 hypothetical protein [Enterobacter roggenkampii]